MKNSATPASGSISKVVPGPTQMRYYSAYHLMAWQPPGVLDDRLLDEIGEWIVAIEKMSLPFKRYVDLSRLTTISVRTRHVFKFARKRVDEFKGLEAVRSAIFSDDWIGYGIATLYQSLMADTPIQVRAFHERSKAAEWLDVPATILSLKDSPTPAH